MHSTQHVTPLTFDPQHNCRHRRKAFEVRRLAKPSYFINCGQREKYNILSDEGPTLETLNFTIRIGSTPTFLYPNTSFIYYTDIYRIENYRKYTKQFLLK